MRSNLTRRCGVLLFAAASLFATAAQADRYRVDLIVYQDHTGSGGEQPLPARPPNLSNVIELTDAAQLRAAGISLLPDGSFGMQREWRHLANSNRHKPLIRLAWIQRNPPSDNGPGLRLRSGTSLGSAGGAGTLDSQIYPIDGSVHLLMGRFLHLNADLSYTVRRTSGHLASYRMSERRRMRREEIHHLDSPRLGVLARVTKVKEQEP